MFPPMGFLGSDANMEAPSTCATTWLVITTATPNYRLKLKKKIRRKEVSRDAFNT